MTGWFKLQKLIIGLALVQVILALPSLAILGHSKHYDEIATSATADLAQFTLGNFYNQAVLSQLFCNLFENAGLLSDTDACVVTASKASETLVAFECFSILAALAAFAWLKRFRPSEDRDVGLSSLGADAFTAYFPWAPPTQDQTAPELRKHIEKCLFEFSGQHHAVREIALIEDSFSLIDSFQAVGMLRRKLERLQTLHAQLRWERGDQWKFGTLEQYDMRAAKEGFDFRSDPDYSIGLSEGGLACICSSRSSSIARVEQDMVRVAAQQKELKQEAMDHTRQGQKLHNFSVRGAFVTFETLEGKETAQHVFVDKWAPSCCRPNNLKLHYEHLGQPRSKIPRAKKAPPPDVINWPSFALSGRAVKCRRTCTCLVSLAVVIISIVITIGASVSQRALQPTDADCPAWFVPQASTASNKTLIDAVGADCICASIAWKDMPLNELKSHELRAQCGDEFCPALVSRSFSELQNAQDCQEWLQSYVTLSSLTVTAAVVTVGINLLLVVFMNRLVSWEAHKSKSSANKSYSERLFIMQFLNMVGVPLVVNAAIAVPEDLQVIQGEAFHDTVPRWYAVVGSALVLTAILNAFIPHVVVAIQYIALRCRRRAETAASQNDLNASFIGPAWNPAKRIAQLMNIVAVCMVFAPSIPIMSVIGLCSAVLFYWVELFALLRVQRTPPHYNTQLLKLSNALFLIILGRIIFALWTFGSTSVLDTQAVFQGSFLRSLSPSSCDWAITEVASRSTNDGSSITPGSVTAGLVVRFCNRHLLPLWIIALIVVLLTGALVGLHFFGKGLVCCCAALSCGACGSVGRVKRKHKAHLYKSTFSQLAQKPKDGSRAVLSGLLSYNILHNEEYRSQFGYDSNFLKGLDGTGTPIKGPEWRPRSLLDLHYFDAMAATGSVALARRRRRSRAASFASPTPSANSPHTAHAMHSPGGFQALSVGDQRWEQPSSPQQQPPTWGVHVPGSSNMHPGHMEPGAPASYGQAMPTSEAAMSFPDLHVHQAGMLVNPLHAVQARPPSPHQLAPPNDVAIGIGSLVSLDAQSSDASGSSSTSETESGSGSSSDSDGSSSSSDDEMFPTAALSNQQWSSESASTPELVEVAAVAVSHSSSESDVASTAGVARAAPGTVQQAAEHTVFHNPLQHRTPATAPHPQPVSSTARSALSGYFSPAVPLARK